MPLANITPPSIITAKVPKRYGRIIDATPSRMLVTALNFVELTGRLLEKYGID
jgi:hypothetical protein